LHRWAGCQSVSGVSSLHIAGPGFSFAASGASHFQAQSLKSPRLPAVCPLAHCPTGGGQCREEPEAWGSGLAAARGLGPGLHDAVVIYSLHYVKWLRFCFQSAQSFSAKGDLDPRGHLAMSGHIYIYLCWTLNPGGAPGI
jgi:hypothetical protein